MLSTRTYLLLALLAAGLTACHKPAAKPEAAAAPVLNVQTITIAEQHSPGFVEVTGTVVGKTSVALSTKLMSTIELLKVEEGQRVKAGQVLAKIDDTDIQAMLSEAAAYRAEATAALGEVAAVVEQGKAGKAQAEAAVKQAQAAYDDAKRDYERAERLAKEDSIPRVQRDKAQLGMKVAEENLSRAKSAVQQADAAIAQAKSKEPQIAAKQQQADAKAAQAAAMADYATLVAPIDGVVTKKFFEQGQLAIPGQPVLIVEDAGSFRLRAAVPENMRAGLKLGQEMEVSLDDEAAAAQIIKGKIVILGAAADPASHTVSLELELPATAGLFSGRFARLRIPAGDKVLLTVPASAVQHEGDLSFVWRVSPGGLLAQVPVELGAEREGLVEVVRGLSTGDVVVEQPGADLYNGARVAQAGVGGEGGQ